MTRNLAKRGKRLFRRRYS